jgi:hypothetical protein
VLTDHVSYFTIDDMMSRGSLPPVPLADAALGRELVRFRIRD